MRRERNKENDTEKLRGQVEEDSKTTGNERHAKGRKTE
jgi:hypothetical protein